ncbi:MAG: hypothetical protein QGG40_22275, partial [Myxococcota bacterium]|nr:hypothetical protein [Myxococcota bacterium]
MDLVLLAVLGLGVVLTTRYLVLDGLEHLADGLGWSTKTRGKLLGFATSVPELVATLATASRGLLGAGLWNIASSNILNTALFLAAALRYRRAKRVLQRRFIDELGFAMGA